VLYNDAICIKYKYFNFIKNNKFKL
jgi:hypothetical protein